MCAGTGWGGECKEWEGQVSFKVCCLPDLIYGGSVECNIIVMANAAVLVCSNTDVVFIKGKLKILGGSRKEL